MARATLTTLSLTPCVRRVTLWSKTAHQSPSSCTPAVATLGTPQISSRVKCLSLKYCCSHSLTKRRSLSLKSKNYRPNWPLKTLSRQQQTCRTITSKPAWMSRISKPRPWPTYSTARRQKATNSIASYATTPFLLMRQSSRQPQSSGT